LTASRQPSNNAGLPLKKAARIVLYVIFFALFWELIWIALRPPAYLLPSMHAVAFYSVEQWPLLLKHTGVTGYETVLGFASAVAGGIAVAYLLQRFPRAASILWPSVLFAQITPKVAIAPLLLLWLGFGIESKILIAFLISFFPVLINAYAGFGAVDEETTELAHSMRVPTWTFFCRFQLPHAMPRVFGGARIAINFALVGAVVGEFVGSDQGLGNLVIVGARTLNSPLMFSAIVMLVIMGASLFFTVGLVERWTIPWHVSYRRASEADSAAAAFHPA
jgi:NitT/TauT family transport system permease protein